MPSKLFLIPAVCCLILVTATLAGCQPAAAPMARSAVPIHPLVDGLPAGETRGRVTLPLIEFGENGIAQTAMNPTIIDTRTFPAGNRQGEPWTGETKRPGGMLPPHTRDKSLQRGPVNALRAGQILDQPRAVPGAFFPGISRTPWNPPDPCLAVGPSHVVVTVNMAVAFYDKDGNEQFFSNLDETGDPGFFEGVGAGGFTFDPKCFYDPGSQRFVILALEVYEDPDEGWITIAVSDDDDPNGIWYKYRTWAVITDNGAEYWPDYPGLGFDDNAFYVTANLFGFESGFLGALYRIFPKAPMLAGNTVNVTDLNDPSAASVQVAQCIDPRPTPLFVSKQNDSQLRIQSIQGPVGPIPNLITRSVDIPSYENPNLGAPNLGGGLLNTLDGRIMNVMYRQNALWTTHAVRGSDDNTKIRWYQLDVSSSALLDPLLLKQAGDIDLGNGDHVFFPAIAVNRYDDAGLVFARSNAEEYASIQVSGRRSNDPLGTMGIPVLVKAGEAGADGRWGDYFDITVDPTDDTTFWIVGEYATLVDDASSWQTWIGTLEISCPGDLDGDGSVGVDDLLEVLESFGDPGPQGDANVDGTVNVDDVLIVISKWGGCPIAP